MSDLQSELARIQRELKAPKSQRNDFGKYNYRNCEDILEAVKPLLGDCLLNITDELVLIGERYYIKATASIRLNGEAIASTAYAREEEIKKGMDASQITGSASSYARKYALNGLLLIDDTKDADHSSQHQKASKPDNSMAIIESLNNCRNLDDLKAWWLGLSKDEQAKHKKAKDTKKAQLEAMQ